MPSLRRSKDNPQKNILAQGAEAIIRLKEDQISKERFKKYYRHPLLDLSLRRSRTKREAKVLEKLKELNFPSPRLEGFSDQKMTLKMSFVPGIKVRDFLRSPSLKTSELSVIAREIGRLTAKLHQNNMIHGDLTTSNLIWDNNKKQLFFIDFGLSFFSDKAEDKAVDLFLLDRALESTHYQYYPKVFELIKESYKEDYHGSELILDRFLQVTSRGRNKKKSSSLKLKSN
jgi:Kae1-associated kinase Bud32